MTLLRLYLRNTRCTAPEDIMADAFGAREPGAVTLVTLVAQVRGNPRSRRSLAVVSREWHRLRRMGPVAPTRKWYRKLANHVLGLYRLQRTYAFPMQPRPSTPALTERLRRSTRRDLAYTGAVQVELPSLR